MQLIILFHNVRFFLWIAFQDTFSCSNVGKVLNGFMVFYLALYHSLFNNLLFHKLCFGFFILLPNNTAKERKVTFIVHPEIFGIFNILKNTFFVGKNL